MLKDPHLRARDYYETVRHPACGEWQIHGWEWKPQGSGRCIRHIASDFGGDNHAILKEVAGFSQDAIEALEAAGVVADTPIGIPVLDPPSSS